jgi:hypothetical protein
MRCSAHGGIKLDFYICTKSVTTFITSKRALHIYISLYHQRAIYHIQFAHLSLYIKISLHIYGRIILFVIISSSFHRMLVVDFAFTIGDLES